MKLCNHANAENLKLALFQILEHCEITDTLWLTLQLYSPCDPSAVTCVCFLLDVVNQTKEEEEENAF